MVIDIGRIKDRDYQYVFRDVFGVVEAVRKFDYRSNPSILKVIELKN